MIIDAKYVLRFLPFRRGVLLPGLVLASWECKRKFLSDLSQETEILKGFKVCIGSRSVRWECIIEKSPITIIDGA